MSKPKTISDKPPEIGSKVIITNNLCNRYLVGEICKVYKHHGSKGLFYVESKSGMRQMVDWDDCQPYTELLKSKEKTKMEQKTKWYKPWTWFAKKPEIKGEETTYTRIDEVGLVSDLPKIAPETRPSMASYTPPRNIPKKKAVKKTAPKKKPAPKKKKAGKK